MLLSEELQEIFLIVAEAGLPELAGNMVSYALSQPNRYFGDDSDGKEEEEPKTQLLRAIHFLRFQILISEEHIGSAKTLATKLQNGSDTPIAFVPRSPDHDSGDEGDMEGLEFFAKELRKEKWTSKHQVYTLRALESLFDMIELKEAQVDVSNSTTS